ncbi:MAG: ATP synthase F1 subunit epsilon [Sandaracinaceae bacterium]|nr:ATP synthase F1 subunit epsilon [Sandaracinaceae bacterium]MDW8245523.1 ATP synthase F1 subunit epsilon [Sandaracinaceae bacterium]
MTLLNEMLLEVVTPSGLALRTSVQSTSAPSIHGEFTVLPGHIPVLAALKPGLLSYRASQKDHAAAVDTGFIEVTPSHVIVLTEHFLRPEDIDGEAVRAELQQAEMQLAALKEGIEGAKFIELQHKIAWCMARLELKAWKEKQFST